MANEFPSAEAWQATYDASPFASLPASADQVSRHPFWHDIRGVGLYRAGDPVSGAGCADGGAVATSYRTLEVGWPHPSTTPGGPAALGAVI